MRWSPEPSLHRDPRHGARSLASGPESVGAAPYPRSAMETIGNNCGGEDLREPRREEAIARDLVTPYIDGQLVAIEDPPDFALCRDNTIVGWAEVTTAVDGERLALENWIAKNDFAFTCSDLTHDWNIIPHKTARLDKLDRDTLVGLLVDWESDNSEESGFIDTWQHPPLVALMLDVRIEWLQYTPPLATNPQCRSSCPGTAAPSGRRLSMISRSTRLPRRWPRSPAAMVNDISSFSSTMTIPLRLG